MKNFVRILSSVFLIMWLAFIFNPIHGQSQEKDLTPKEKWKSAERNLLLENYTESIRLFKQLYEKQKENNHFAYKIGYTYIISEDLQNVESAIDYLKFASDNIHKRPRNKFKEKRAPQNTLYYLGVAYRLNEQYPEAIDAFNRYEQIMSRKEARSIQGQFLEREIQSCKDALEFIDYEQMKIEKLIISGLENPNVRCPILCHEANRLIFTNGEYNIFPPDINYDRDYNDNPMDHVFMATRDERGKFHSPVNISMDLDIRYPYIPVTATADGSELYLIVDIGDNGQIYLSKFEDGKYQKAEPVKALNTRKWESHASISPDGKRIYFTSDRRGGYGGLDIWYSDRDEDGKWQKPINLGPEINTPFHEEMPYISRNGKVLYFSSEGHMNIGGFDVFGSFYDEENEKWGEPQNLNYPFSTTGNDMGYIVENPPHFVFCPVNDNKRRKGIEDCDCISITESATPMLATVSGIVRIENSDLEIPLDSRLRVINKDNMEEVYNKTLNHDGTFTIEDIAPGTYEMIVYKDNEDFNSLTIDVPKNNSGSISGIEIFIPKTEIIAQQTDDRQPVAAGFTRIKNVFFENNSSKVHSTFNNDLKTIAGLLKQNPNSKIELHAYCSHTGSKEYNIKLGQRRAESVKKMLIEFGANDNQIIIQNHGQADYLAIGDFADSRVYNKRVEIVAKDDLSKLKTLNAYIPSYYRLTSKEYDYNSGTFFYTEEEIIDAIIFEAVLFDFDKYTINDKNYSNLNNVADYLKTYSNAKIRIIGHTDHYGSDKYNVVLSQRRTKEVEKYLLDKGVNSNQLEIDWQGKTKNITIQTTNDLIRRLNRRVELEIIQKGDKPAVVAPVFVPERFRK